jgi:two-component system response regulator MprA
MSKPFASTLPQPTDAMPARHYVLVVDDDQALRRAVARALELDGYSVDVAEDGAKALAFFDEGTAPPDAVVLDLLMPNLDGIAACRAIRATSSVPILILTARQSVEERVEGLDAGADDYLGKPFAVVELLARLRALLRRVTPEQRTLHYGDLTLDTNERRAYRAGHRIDLTRIEFSLLELFMDHPNKVLSRSSIFQAVWGYDLDFASNSLEVYVGYLRRKTEADGKSRLIQTVRGIGYVMRETA